MRVAVVIAALLALTACGADPVPAPAASGDAKPIAASAAPPGPVAQPLSQVACAAGETPIFACRFADGKRLSVCGIATGKAEYRFGRDLPELVLSGGERASTPYSGGGEAQLAFSNGETRYIVFSRVVRTGFGEEGNNPAISDGVVIERGGTFAAIRICNDPEVLAVDQTAAETFIPEAASLEYGTLFTEETIRADPATP